MDWNLSNFKNQIWSKYYFFLDGKIWLNNYTEIFQHMVYNHKIEKYKLFHKIA